MKPEGGVTLIIAVGGGKAPSRGHSRKDKKGCEMIKLPIEALAAEDEAGEGVVPEVGDTVTLDVVEGEVSVVNDDGTVHVDLKTAGGVPVEYVEHVSEEVVEEIPEEGVEDLAEEEAELLAAAEEEDKKRGY